MDAEHVFEIRQYMNSESPLGAEPMSWEGEGQGVTVGVNQLPTGTPVFKPVVTFGGVENREAITKVTDEELAAELLKRVGALLAPGDPHSVDTPKRFVQSLRELCEPAPSFKFTTFETDSDDMVVVGPIPFYTLCAHHIVPFHGNAWIGYVPQGKLCGLSKLARTVKYMSKGTWVQEGLTQAIHNYIHAHMQTRGIAVVLRAEHMYISMRGVQVAGAMTTTAKMSGVFGDHERTAKAEFMQWTGVNK